MVMITVVMEAWLLVVMNAAIDTSTGRSYIVPVVVMAAAVVIECRW